MIFKKGLPKFNQKLHNELINNGWIQLKEPGSPAVAIALSIPFMILNLLITVLFMSTYTMISFEEFGFSLDDISITINLGMIMAVFSLIILHEALHLVFIPNFKQSTKTVVGLTFFGAFVVTEEEIRKTRYILITIAPFLIISILLPLILNLLGYLTSSVKLFVMLNAMASSVDILHLLLVLKQVPAKTLLKGNGPNTYWTYYLAP